MPFQSSPTNLEIFQLTVSTPGDSDTMFLFSGTLNTQAVRASDGIYRDTCQLFLRLPQPAQQFPQISSSQFRGGKAIVFPTAVDIESDGTTPTKRYHWSIENVDVALDAGSRNVMLNFSIFMQCDGSGNRIAIPGFAFSGSFFADMS